jgi:hypothetical protein
VLELVPIASRTDQGGFYSKSQQHREQHQASSLLLSSPCTYIPLRVVSQDGLTTCFLSDSGRSLDESRCAIVRTTNPRIRIYLTTRIGRGPKSLQFMPSWPLALHDSLPQHSFNRTQRKHTQTSTTAKYTWTTTSPSD